MSLRARLVSVVAGVMIGPLVAAWIVIGFVVPRQSWASAQSEVSRESAAVVTTLVESCRGLGDAVSTVAAGVAAGVGTDRAVPIPRATSQIAEAELRHPGTSFAVLSRTGQTLAGGFRDISDAQGDQPADPAIGSCSAPPLASAVTVGSPQIVESEAISVLGRDVATVIGRTPLNDEALRALAERLRLRGQVSLISGERIVASTGSRERVRQALQATALGRVQGRADGLAFDLENPGKGLAYGVLLTVPVRGAEVQVILGAVVLVFAAGALGLVGLLARGVVRPLATLAAAAERFGAGELDARSELSGSDDVGRLAAAFDTMAAELQTRLGELRAGRDLIADTFDRFGEALGRTHDLDGLLHTVLDAALRGSDGMVAVAVLGRDGEFSEVVSTVSDTASGEASGAFEELTALARMAAVEHVTVTTESVACAGSAVALPLESDHGVIGALAIARGPGDGPFDEPALSAVAALGTHVGTAVGNVRAHEETRRLSVTDPLTGAGNFRQLSTTLAREVERAHRFGRPLSVMMLDLDHFKQVNDTLGHAFGDAVLREFARRLQDCLREVDTVARYGGEEFAVVLPETDPDGATRVASRIVEAVRAVPFVAAGISREVSVSVGVASFPQHGRSAADVMRAADSALYAAKRAGRDRWCLAGVNIPGQSVIFRHE